MIRPRPSIVILISLSFFISFVFYIRIILKPSPRVEAFSPVFRCGFHPLVDALKYQFQMGFEYWRHLDSLGLGYVEAALDQLFPPIRGGDRTHRHFSYRPDFEAYVPNWSSDFLWQTKRIQDLIYRHQHPSDCSRAKFIIAGSGWTSGLGSYLHQIACIWVKALETGRIFAYHPNQSFYPRLEGPFCGNHSNGDCLFERVTNCTIREDSDVITGGRNSGAYPRWLGDLLEDSMVAHDPYAFSWFWKAQVMGYLCRTKERVRQFIEQAFRDSDIPLELYRPNGIDVGVHVRHSDRVEPRSTSNEEYAAMVYTARKLLGRNPTVFLATDDQGSVTYFKSLPGMTVYTFNGPNRNKWKDDESRNQAGDISSLWAWADVEAMAQCNILIGGFLSNFMRVPMELRATRYGLASNLFMEAGELPCVSMSHCEYHDIPWLFDFYIRFRTSWESFNTSTFPQKKSGERLTQAFRMKLAKPDILPQSIEQYLSVAGPRMDWPT
jgi:hypothetical protein